MVVFQASALSRLGRQERCLWAEMPVLNQPCKQLPPLSVFMGSPTSGMLASAPNITSKHSSLSPAFTSLAPIWHVIQG